MLRLLLFICISLQLSAQQEIKSPKDYFTQYGTQHTFFHQVMEYIAYLDLNSERILVQKTGETYQGRLLYLVYVSSGKNLQNLENIRLTNLYNAGTVSEKPAVIDEKAIVWCSFGVHGNEAGCTESVPEILYRLASANDANTISWLDRSVVIIDPSLNPDGYDRYVHFLKSVSGTQLHPDATHREHMEPWPSGRYNHYMFDMNRDWAWQTQRETKARIEAYNRWLPHVHADFHEMGYNNHYYFAPAAEPYHAFLTPFQREFQIEIGKNHASYFDKKGWLYWTREVFDLFYPSYGDTYPCYSGAIGMTYEQAGNTASGRAIQTENGDTLTIQDKIDHNTVVALSTIEVSSGNSERLIENFKKYFSESRKNPKGKYRTYILKDNPALQRMADILKRSGIRVDYAAQSVSLNGYHYQSSSMKTVEVKPGDMIIQSAQPRSVLLQVLMEEEAALSDSVTYDITAWTLPFAYQADCYGFVNEITVKTTSSYPEKSASIVKEGPVFSVEVPWNDLNSARLLAALHKKGYKVRMAVKETSFGGRKVSKGSLFINRGDNSRKADYEKEILNVIRAAGIREYHLHQTGFSDKGGDLGGYSFEMVKAPKVLTFSGRGVSASSCGEIWYYFDQLLGYPLSLVDWDRFDRIKLEEFNTIILPDGYYQISKERLQQLSDWTEKGGRLIVIEGAIGSFQDKEGLNMSLFATEEEKTKAEEDRLKQELMDRLNDFEGLERRNISKGTAGAIVKNSVDDSHPLGYGIGKQYYSLKTSSAVYALQKGMWNVIHVPKGYKSYGFIGSGLRKNLEEKVSFAVQARGSGQAIYMVDNPLFRCFWDKGLLLFSNAVFLNSSLPENY